MFHVKHRWLRLFAECLIVGADHVGVGSPAAANNPPPPRRAPATPRFVAGIVLARSKPRVAISRIVLLSGGHVDSTALRGLEIGKLRVSPRQERTILDRLHQSG